MEVSKKVQQIIDLIKDLTVVELNSLVKSLEEEFGVSAAAMVAVGGGATGASDAGEEKAAASNIELTSAGGQKIAVIKVVKELLGLGLKEAKDLVDQAPVILKENVSDEEVEAIKAKLEEVGATISVK